MKTLKTKTLAVTAIMAIALGVNAQDTKQKQTCISIISDVNGKTVKIDTCFSNMDNADIEKALSAMGVKDMPDINISLDSVNTIISANSFKGDSVKAEVIMINDSEEGDDKAEKIKVSGGKNGNAYAYIIGDDGKVSISSSDGDDGDVKVIIKKDGDDEVISCTTKDGKSTTTTKNAKVFMFEKVIVKNLSDEDKKNLPADATSNGSPFTGLKLSPNPTEGTVNIAYTSNSTEPLQIDVYDMNGKKVHSETDNDMQGQVSKTISLSDFGQGIYFVHLLQGNQSETRKIVVK
jgi:hypothetical protein